MLQILSFGLFFTRYSLSCSTYVAIGKPQYLTVVQLLNIVSMLVLIPVLHALYGVPGAMWAIALYRMPSSAAAIFFNIRHAIHSTLFEIAVLPTWGVGWLLGWGSSLVIQQARAWH